MAKLNASDVLQFFLLIDQASAAVLRIIQGAGALSNADEADLKKQLAAIRARNNERFDAIEASLKAKAGTSG